MYNLVYVETSNLSFLVFKAYVSATIAPVFAVFVQTA